MTGRMRTARSTLARFEIGGKSNGAALARRRHHQLPYCIEYAGDCLIVAGELSGRTCCSNSSKRRASSVFEVSTSRRRTNVRMISILAAIARGLRRTEESMATPCSVKA